MNTLAQNSNITICSLEHFIELCENLGINDSNVEEYDGKFCFIEIGSTLARCQMDAAVGANYEKYDFDGKRFYEEGQYYFKTEHSNVLRLEFDDNINFYENMKVKLSPNEVKPNFDPQVFNNSEGFPGKIKRHKEGWLMNYRGGQAFSIEQAEQTEDFIEENIQKNPDVKFVIHCKEGKSRSAALGYYLAKRLEIDIEKYLQEYEKDTVFRNDETGEETTHKTSQFRLGDKNGKKNRMNHRVFSMMDAVRGQRKGDKRSMDKYAKYKEFGKYGEFGGPDKMLFKDLDAYIGDKENPNIIYKKDGWTRLENKQRNILKLTESEIYFILKETMRKLL